MPRIAENTVNSEEYWQGLYERREYLTRDDTNIARYWAAAVCQVGRTALDIGCGQGGLGLALSQACPLVRYTGWDYAQSAIDTTIVPEDAHAILERKDWCHDRGAEMWDTVYLLEMLEHEPDPKHLVVNAASSARERIVVTVPRRGVLSPAEHRNEHYWDFEPDEIRELFGAYGIVSGPSKVNHLCDLYVVDMFKVEEQ